MPPLVAVTDSPAGDDLSLEREILSGISVEKITWGDAAELRDKLCEVDGVLCMHAPVNRGVISGMRRCRGIVRYGTGLDNIDVSAAAEAGIPVWAVRDYCTEEVANHTIALLLAWNRRLVEYHDMVLSGMWNQRDKTTGNWGYQLERLSNQILGIAGFGNIGRAVAVRARAVGMRVLAYSRSPSIDEARLAGAEIVSWEQLLANSDFVSLHLPLTEKTRGIVNAEALRAMKTTAALINTARGGLVDETALVEALLSGEMGGALLDVYQHAPLPLDHPLRGCRNVILTPHVGFYSEGALSELRRRAAEQMRRSFSPDEGSYGVSRKSK